MNLVDSSGWLEYFSGAENSERFASPLQDTSTLIVPVITLYEVFKVVMRESTENDVLQAVVAMQQGKVIELTTLIAMDASRLSLKHGLPMANSIILSTARMFDCLIWTQDADIAGLPGVKFFPEAKAESTNS